MPAETLFLERPGTGVEKPADGFDDATLLDVWKRCKRESFEHRWVYERSWMRNLHYALRRHWIEYVRRSNEWRDVKLAKSFPKPTSPLLSVGIVTLRSMFAAVDTTVSVRPNGADPNNVAVAAIAEEYYPVLHEEQDMESVLDEADGWFIITGNTFLHTFFERDAKYGFDEIEIEQCATCGAIYDSAEIADAKNVCPDCGASEFAPAVDELGEPVPPKRIAKGKGVTIALSPFEIAFPPTYARFDDVPYIIRLRWRPKTYYENHPTLKTQVVGFPWSKASSETSLQLFRSLPFQNDIGMSSFMGVGVGMSEEEGASEYEVAYRPCDQYPEGLVFRVLGDANPIVLRLEEDEGIPGKLPYTDAKGKPIFTYTHAAFEQKGGRVWGEGPVDAVIPKINVLNQHDAFGLMTINRVANPFWLIPKGAGIEKMTGDPGMVVRWDSLTTGGVKPERIDGIGLGGWFFQMRDQHVKDIEDTLGTSDVLKGQKPGGVDSFAGMQLLVDRGQSRFTSAFKARGRLIKDWAKFALEIERQFGPDERTEWVLTPARSWAEKVFKRADLDGSFTTYVEEGSQKPKSALGVRAAIQHLNSLAMINPNDPDQVYAIYQAFGQTKLAPSLDIHMQAALRKQQAFEEWAIDPAAQQQSLEAAQQDTLAYEQQLAQIQPVQAAPQIDPQTGMEIPPDAAMEEQQAQAQMPPPPSITKHTPLKWRRAYKATIHHQEFLKWANSDKVIQLLTENPALEAILDAHQQEIEMAMGEQAMIMASAQGMAPPQGAGMALANSNQEAGSSQAAA